MYYKRVGEKHIFEIYFLMTFKSIYIYDNLSTPPKFHDCNLAENRTKIWFQQFRPFFVGC
jgi:hypothetical protein